jgi:hypothetical protein
LHHTRFFFASYVLNLWRCTISTMWVLLGFTPFPSCISQLWYESV